MRQASIYLEPPRYRGCQLCAHGCTTDGTRCSNPTMATEPTRDVVALRAPGGACGPEAKFLDFPGLND